MAVRRFLRAENVNILWVLSGFFGYVRIFLCVLLLEDKISEFTNSIRLYKETVFYTYTSYKWLHERQEDLITQQLNTIRLYLFFLTL